MSFGIPEMFNAFIAGALLMTLITIEMPSWLKFTGGLLLIGNIICAVV
jgi:ABC-type cobalamin transport system permease subunit